VKQRPREDARKFARSALLDLAGSTARRLDGSTARRLDGSTARRPPVCRPPVFDRGRGFDRGNGL
jgi:hypothetical protein